MEPVIKFTRMAVVSHTLTLTDKVKNITSLFVITTKVSKLKLATLNTDTTVKL